MEVRLTPAMLSSLQERLRVAGERALRCTGARSS